MLAWLKTTTGIVVAIFAGILLIFLIIKGQSIKDSITERLYNKKTISSEAHGDTAKHEIAAADTASKEGRLTLEEWQRLASTPETRANPQAMRVVTTGNKVIANKNKEITHLRAADSQLQKQVVDLETRPEKPVPRLIPYVDPLYSVRSNGKPIINLRAGIDYRIINHVSAKVEVAYEPPATGSLKQNPEFRLNVGAHITFR